MASLETFVVKYAGQGLHSLYGQLLSTSDDKIEVVDPLCAMVKLGLLHFKPKDTKVSISDHKIYVQDPSWYQGGVRWFYSDERGDLYQLRYPITYFIGLCNGFIAIERDGITAEQLNIIKTEVSDGLKRLRSTYETAKKTGSMVRNCLDTYIKSLGREWTAEEFQKELSEIGKPTIFVIYNEFMKKWTAQDIQFILDTFAIMKSKTDQGNENVLNRLADTINCFIDAKDIEIDALRPD
jgi:hypothetical protein